MGLNEQFGFHMVFATHMRSPLRESRLRCMPAGADVPGVSFAANPAQVNGLATYRKGGFFRKELPVDNSGGRHEGI